jgi:hypothetical protein
MPADGCEMTACIDPVDRQELEMYIKDIFQGLPVTICNT